MIKSISDYQSFVEKAVKAYQLPQNPANLYDPLRYFLEIGGKRMRPVLALMGAELFNSDYSIAKNAALSIELFHNFSLIHDDIMDEAPLRRGSETVHKKWNNNIAILSGDTLLIESYKLLATYPPHVLAEILPLFNQTASEVCEGQQMDMDFESLNHVEIEDYIKMIAFKTAVLLGCSLKMGAIVGGANNADGQSLYEFGLNLGIAFQIQDDILDVYADQNKFGKQVGGDIISNKKTYLLLSALKFANHAQSEKLNSLLVEPNPEVKVEAVKAIYDSIGVREMATKAMNHYHDLAIQNLNQLAVEESKKAPLRSLAEFLLGREH